MGHPASTSPQRIIEGLFLILGFFFLPLALSALAAVRTQSAAHRNMIQTRWPALAALWTTVASSATLIVLGIVFFLAGGMRVAVLQTVAFVNMIALGVSLVVIALFRHGRTPTLLIVMANAIGLCCWFFVALVR